MKLSNLNFKERLSVIVSSLLIMGGFSLSIHGMIMPGSQDKDPVITITPIVRFSNPRKK